VFSVRRIHASRGSSQCAPTPARKRRESGFSLVEFALMLPFLLLLGTGVVELGRAVAITILVNNGAAAGVGYGAQDSLTAQDTAGMQNAAKADASFGSMTATGANGCTCDYGTGTSCSYPILEGSCPTISCPGGQVVECVQVTTHASFTPLFHFPGLPASYQANGAAVMRVRR
jgi:Flp pilus assembly protein TadG